MGKGACNWLLSASLFSHLFLLQYNAAIASNPVRLSVQRRVFCTGIDISTVCGRFLRMSRWISLRTGHLVHVRSTECTSSVRDSKVGLL